MKFLFYDFLDYVMFPICKIIGHKWETKEKSLLGFDCKKECKRCKSFVSVIKCKEGN